MDPVSHLLFGRTVALTISRRRSLAGVTAALVLGSLVPDVDAVLAPWRFDLYLRAHAAGTHSLAGALGGALVLALILRPVFSESRVWPLFLASLAGTLGHIFWDVADGSDIHLLVPFSDALFGWHLVSMGEPIVLIVLAAVVLGAWRWPARARSAAATGLVLLAVFLATKRVAQGQARARYTATMGAAEAPSIAIAPVPGRLFSWTVYDRAGDHVYAWTVDTTNGRVAAAFDYRDASETPVARISRDLPVVRVFLGLSRMPFARTERVGGEQLVLWSDAASCSVVGCDVSFGGAFDTTLTPLYQVIHIGGFSQRRSLPSAR